MNGAESSGLLPRQAVPPLDDRDDAVARAARILGVTPAAERVVTTSLATRVDVASAPAASMLQTAPRPLLETSQDAPCGIVTRNLDYYRTIHATSTYGVSATRRAEWIIPHFKALAPAAALDYGCGRCEIVKEFGTKGFLFDPAIPERATIPAAFFDTPYENRAVLCSHVIEHVDLAEADAILEHIRSLAPNAFFIIPTTTARKVLPSGENAHSLVRDRAWWIEKLAEYFPTIHLVKGHRNGELYFCTWSNTDSKLRVNRISKTKINHDGLPDLVGKTIAVVGRAASLHGSGEGAAIDACDLVVRVNIILPLEPRHAVDVGRRTDLIFLNASCKPAANAAKKAGVPVTRYDKSFRNTLKDDDGFVPFTGTVAIFWLLAQGARHIYATGMDLYAGAPINGHGGHLRTKQGTGTHDPSKDKIMLQDLVGSGKFSAGVALSAQLAAPGDIEHFAGLEPDYSNYRPTTMTDARRMLRRRRPRGANLNRPQEKPRSLGGATGSTLADIPDRSRLRRRVVVRVNGRTSMKSVPVITSSGVTL